MSRSATLRALRMELLQIQARQIRLSLREDFDGLKLSRGVSLREGLAWLGTFSGVFASVLPARWGRWLNVGTGLWRIGRRLLSVFKKNMDDMV